RVVEVEHVGLGNQAAGERLAPECIQDDATPGALADALLPLLDEGPPRTRILAGLDRGRAALKPPPRAGDAAAPDPARAGALPPPRDPRALACPPGWSECARR